MRVRLELFLTGKGPTKKQVDVAQKSSRIAEHKRAALTVAPVKETKPVQQKTLKERCKERFGDEKLTPARLAVLSCAKETIDLRPIVESNKVGEVRLKRYSNPLHQELVKYVHPGMPCDVPDGITDKEARKLCDGKMEYNFDDPDDVLEEKKAVEELVGQLRKHLDDGGHAQDFFKQLMERQDAEYEMMKTAKKNITELCRNGDKNWRKKLLISIMRI